jgi:O-antigen biosynthesis protein
VSLVLPQVDIIVPIYKNAELTKRCIESLYRWKQETPYRLILINDASPEPEINRLLNECNHENTIVLHNTTNLGFVGTVNKGLLLSNENDVVLLNSDTEVTSRWLDKMRACAYQDERIGTVTPFSNNATICSYPRFCKDNLIPVGYTPEALNTLFEEHFSGMYEDIPTAVGFCMYIKRQTIKEVGLFDVEHFGRGYGEENDFSRRAAKKNWRNVICLDTFVHHVGRASFGDDQIDLSKNAKKILDDLHPEYEGLIHKYITLNPLKKVRFTIDIARYLRAPKPSLLLITHNLGGGTERFVREMGAAWASQGYPTFIIRPYGEMLSFTSGDPNDEFELFFHVNKQYSLLVDWCKALGVCHVHINHLMGHVQQIWSLAEDIGVNYDVTIHDYYAICPLISLSGNDHHYCGEKGIEQCTTCLKQNRQAGVTEIISWRNHWEDLLIKARKIWVPSWDVAIRLKKYFHRIEFNVLPHPEKYSDQQVIVAKSAPAGNRIKVAALGALSKIKGAELLYKCAEDAKRRQLPIDYYLIGYTWRQVKPDPDIPIAITGPYQEEQLVTKLKDRKIDVVFFPNQCPETYSYTLSSALISGYPVVATNIGAVAERVKRDDVGWIIDTGATPEEINNEFLRILNNPQEYREKAENVLRVTFEREFPPIEEYYLGVSFSNIQKVVNFNITKLLEECVPKRNIKLKVLSWLLEHKHLPILRELNRVLNHKTKQKIKWYLKKTGII